MTWPVQTRILPKSSALSSVGRDPVHSREVATCAIWVVCGFGPHPRAVEEDEGACTMGQVPSYVQWGFIQISVPNLVVIVLMLVVFGLALVLPNPHRRVTGGPR